MAKRAFINFHPIDEQHELAAFRLLQFNMLADGLSGLREDLGGFYQATTEELVWNNRKGRILTEILQYDPDVITLQECDHYYDFFLPKLSELGFTGVFAPKPISTCLEVSQNSDGCAIFLRQRKFQISSIEVCQHDAIPNC